MMRLILAWWAANAAFVLALYGAAPGHRKPPEPTLRLIRGGASDE